MAITSGVKYRDLNSRFGETGQPPVLQGDASVRASLRNLLSSYIGSRSRTFNQRWGSAVMEVLQEPITQVTAGALRVAVSGTIKTWEPRVSLIDSQCTFVPNMVLPGYDVKLVYRINDSSTVYAYLISLQA